MYRYGKVTKTLIEPIELEEGETIEIKVMRLLENKEPIKDGAPLIFTERKEGVLSAYNIRTDRWEVATEAMDLVNKSRIAKRDNLMPKEEVKTIDLDTGGEPTAGKKTG
ncbi:MAG: hypothetical protein [Microviridae sp.]|nr:MAG: hypothetical protein [Microviridae sp.]